MMAILIKLTSLEERFISPSIDRQVTYYEASPLLEAAMQTWAEGKPEQAIETLYRILRQTPHDINVIHLLFEIYCHTEDRDGILKIGSRLIDTFIKDNQLDQAKEIYKSMQFNDHQIYPTPRVFYNMAIAFEHHHETKNAYKAFENIASHYTREGVALKSLVKLAQYHLKVEQDYLQAFSYFVLAKYHPAADQNVAAIVAEGIEQTRRYGGTEVEDMDEADVKGLERYETLVAT